MIQDPAAAELIKAHLRKYEDSLVCPICKKDEWEVGGPIGHLVSDQVEPKFGEIVRRPELFPVAFMVCATCGFVRQFSWSRIRQGEKGIG